MLNKEKLDNPFISMLLLISITIASGVYFLYRFEIWSNDFLDNLFYVFYFNIALYLISGILVKGRPFKIAFFVTAVSCIAFLALYTVFYIYITALAHSFHN